MSALVGSLSEFVTLLVQSFNFSALFPSFVFMILNALFVFPLFKGTDTHTMIAELDASLQILIVATLILGLAYLLNALNYSIIRALEGYPFRTQFPFYRWERAYRSRVRENSNLMAQYTNTIGDIDLILEDIPYKDLEPYRDLRKTLRSRKDALAAEQLFVYPVSDWRVLPTPLGNIIAAAEDYPQLLFGIDSVLMWPYLRPILTKSGYAKFVEREKSVFDLLMNSMVLTIVFSLEIICFDIYIYGPTPRLLIELALFVPAIASLYFLCLRGAGGWASTIRAAFVLHRDQLRESLGLARPSTYKDEWALWDKAMRFFHEPANAPSWAESKTLFSYSADDESIVVRVEN